MFFDPNKGPGGLGMTTPMPKAPRPMLGIGAAPMNGAPPPSGMFGPPVAPAAKSGIKQKLKQAMIEGLMSSTPDTGVGVGSKIAQMLALKHGGHI